MLSTRERHLLLSAFYSVQRSDSQRAMLVLCNSEKGVNATANPHQFKIVHLSQTHMPKPMLCHSKWRGLHCQFLSVPHHLPIAVAHHDIHNHPCYSTSIDATKIGSSYGSMSQTG